MSATTQSGGNVAATRAARPQSRLGTWFVHHAYSLVASVGRMVRKPWATALTIGVMAVAITLPLGLWAALSNVERKVIMAAEEQPEPLELTGTP